MSADVSIQVVRKSDGCPFDSIYLGGKALKAEFTADGMEFETTVIGCYVRNLGNLEDCRAFINTYYDAIVSYNGYPDESDWYHGDDFYYWLIVET